MRPVLYAVRAGYRGSDSYHNANRLAYKVVEGFAARCAQALAAEEPQLGRRCRCRR